MTHAAVTDTNPGRSSGTVGAFASLATLLLLTALPTAGAYARTGAATALSHELVYVANADSGPVTAYGSGSSGSVSPRLRVKSPNDPNTYWDPWGVTFDAAGYLYVQTFLSDATSFVFPPGARGKTKPSRIFMGGGPDSRAIAVDSRGYEYVATGQSSAEIVVLPPLANGQPSNMYFVPPLRTIFTDEAIWHPWPDILTTDSRNEVLAAIVRPQGNAIEIYKGGPNGGGSPVRIISGSRTQLGSCAGGPQPCDQVAVTYAPLTGLIYVAVSAGEQSRICVFAGDAKGNVRPLRTIEGPATRLAGMVIPGIAVSPRSGNIYVMVKPGQFGVPGEIDVFGSQAKGDAAPKRIFTDGTTQFVDAQGIAITK